MQCEKEMRAAGQAERADVQTDSEKSTTNEEREVTGAEVMRMMASALDESGKSAGGLPFELYVLKKTLERLSEIADGSAGRSREEIVDMVHRCVSLMGFAMVIGSVTGRENANAAIDRVFEIDGINSDERG